MSAVPSSEPDGPVELATADRQGPTLVAAPPVRRPALRAFLANRAALAATAVLVGIVVLALAAPLLTPHRPEEADFLAPFAEPGTPGHLLGTDDLGRDLLSRVLFGARVSLLAGTGSVLAALVVALPIGLLAGYVGGKLDELLMRIVDILLSIPPLILVFAIAGVIGPSLRNAIIALAILLAPVFVRLIRSETRQVREGQLIEAEQALGVPTWAIVVRHVLPLVAAPVIVQASLNIGTAIIAEASLSFLGLGVRPPTPSWGGMVSQGLQFIQRSPWAVVLPSIAVAITVLAFNIVGDGLRDALSHSERD